MKMAAIRLLLLPQLGVAPSIAAPLALLLRDKSLRMIIVDPVEEGVGVGGGGGAQTPAGAAAVAVAAATEVEVWSSSMGQIADLKVCISRVEFQYSELLGQIRVAERETAATKKENHRLLKIQKEHVSESCVMM